MDACQSPVGPRKLGGLDNHLSYNWTFYLKMSSDRNLLMLCKVEGNKQILTNEVMLSVHKGANLPCLVCHTDPNINLSSRENIHVQTCSGFNYI